MSKLKVKKLTFELEVEDNDFVDEERGGYGALFVFELAPVFGNRTISDEVLGELTKEDIVDFEFIGGSIFVNDQDGGELYESDVDEDELYNHYTKEESIEKLRDAFSSSLNTQVVLFN